MGDEFDGVPPRRDALRRPDGVLLSIARWGGEEATGGTVFIVHGLKDHSERYRRLGSALAEAGFMVVAADLRGHGRSGGPRQWADRFSDYVDDLAAVVDSIPAPGRRFLFAHSMGGAIALRWLLDQRPRLEGLVLSGTAILPPPSVGAGARALTGLLGRVAPRARILRLSPEDFVRDPAAVRRLANDPHVDWSPVPARTAAGLLGSMESVRRRLPEVDVPLLALHGGEDRLTDPSGSALLVRLARSREKVYRPFPGMFHDLLHEPEADVVEEAVRGWLVDHSERRGAADSSTGPTVPESRKAESK